MSSNATRSWRLYAIIDRATAGSRDLAELAAAAIRGGADAIQLRDKAASPKQLADTARQLLPLAHAAGIPLIINDSIEAAREADADGVHLGQDDPPVQQARRRLGPSKLIGKSTHSLVQAVAAEREGADYIGFGPIFPTPTKPAYGSIGLGAIEEAAQQVKILMVCIGGIEQGNLLQVIEAGATCVAVVRAVCASQDPEAATRALKEKLV